ncbi:MAG: hypothetical protein RIS70_3642, partial [Planctomycetota bacterium]
MQVVFRRLLPRLLLSLLPCVSVPVALVADEPQPAATAPAATAPATDEPKTEDDKTNPADETTAEVAPESEEPKPLSADEAKLRDKLSASVKRAAADQTFDLRYKFKANERVSWTVQHLVTHETSVKNVKQTAKSRSVSTKVWKIEKVEADGKIVFEYSVDNVDMWQHVSGRPEVRYNSQKDNDAPREYAQVASMIGVPLTLVTMDPHGTIIDKTYPTKGVTPTVAELAIPLPKTPVKIGAEWTLPEEVKLSLDDKRILRVQIRHVYRLENVEDKIATIAIRTQIVTPIDDPKIQGRLLERMKNGSARFDLESGRF